MTQAQKDEPTSITGGQWPRFVAGGPDQVRVTPEQMAAESGADEIMIQDLIAEPEARRHSHQLLAQGFGLQPRTGQSGEPEGWGRSWILAPCS
ncbi:hypothetical protein [Microlunatus sp. Y2014]|uniref:hypothetical protein n=1 Tax=Microlunatus sp. Y2014 TaxID=3418488 RepID=UPI003DA6F3D6